MLSTLHTTSSVSHLDAPQALDHEDGLEQALYVSSPDCIKILALDGSIQRVSPGGQLALELDRPDQLDNLDWPSLWPGSERERVERAVADGRKGRRTQFLAFCPTTKNTPRWWDVVVTPMPGDGVAPGSLLVVSRDVTELVEAKEALVQANERKDEFLAILSHELRNPLSALSMAATFLEKLPDSNAQLSKVSEMILRQVTHMSRLTEDLLDASRITRREVTLRNEDCDVRKAVQDATEQLSPSLTLKNQRMVLEYPDAPVLVDGDRMRLAQIFGNLIGNASRYSPSNSAIDIHVQADAEFVTVTVSDHGQGIASDLMPTLFDMYSQGQRSADRKAAGIGLGLAIVKGLVDLHGGAVWVESKGLDMGSTFTVLLPLKGHVYHGKAAA